MFSSTKVKLKSVSLLIGIILVFISIWVQPTGLSYTAGDLSSIGQIIDPTDGQVISTSTYTFKWTVGNPNTVDWMYSIDDGLWHDVGQVSSVTINLATIGAGTHNFKLGQNIDTTQDLSSGSTGGEEVLYVVVTDQVDFTYTGSTSVTITKPATTVVETHDVLFEWKVTWDYGGSMTTSYKIDNGDWIVKGTSTTHGTITFSKTATLSDGYHTFYVKAQVTDPVLDPVYAQKTILVSADPYVYITSPRNNTLYQTDDITIDWVADGKTKTITGFNLTLDNTTTISLTAETRTYTWYNIPEGNHYIDIVMQLNDSTTVEHWVKFSTNLSKNCVYIIQPTNDTLIDSTDYTIKWKTDFVENADFLISLKRPDGKNIEYTYSPEDISIEHEMNVSFNMNGAWELSITINDENRSTSQVHFNVSAEQLPEPDIEIHIKSVAWYKSDIIVHWVASAPNPIIKYRVKIDDRDWETTENTTYTFYDVSHGVHTITVQVIDLMGNTAYDTVTAKLEETSQQPTNSINTYKVIPIILSIPFFAFGTVGNNRLWETIKQKIYSIRGKMF